MFLYDKFCLDIQETGKIEARWEPCGGPMVRKEGRLSLSEELRPHVLSYIERLKEERGLDEEQLRLLGESLYKALFPGDIHVLFEQAVRAVRGRNNKRLRVSIGMDEACEVRGWPLEFLRSPLGWLATDNDLTLSRRVVFEEEYGKEPYEPPLKVMVIVSKPEDLPGVMSASVIEAIASWVNEEEELGAPSPAARPQTRTARPSGTGEVRPGVEVKLLGYLEDYERDIPGVEYLKYLKRPATFGDLREVADDWKPHVMHFIGHGQYRGTRGFLALMNDQAEVDWCSDEEFADVLGGFEPRLVVLQACQSALSGTGPGFLSLAEYLVQRSIPAVVAMQFEIRNDYATLFSTEFYRALAQGWEIDAAVQRGRWKIPNDKRGLRWKERHFGTPVLFMLSPSGIIRPVSSVSRQAQERQLQVSQVQEHPPQASLGAAPLSLKEKARQYYEMAAQAAQMGDLETAEYLAERAAELRRGKVEPSAFERGMGLSTQQFGLSDRSGSKFSPS